MAEKERVLTILKEIKPTVNLENTTDIIDGGYMDSMELMGLIAALTDTFDIEIDIDWITPENFNSVDAMAEMVAKLKAQA